jgi:hypothetical protein
MRDPLWGPQWSDSSVGYCYTAVELLWPGWSWTALGSTPARDLQELLELQELMELQELWLKTLQQICVGFYSLTSEYSCMSFQYGFDVLRGILEQIIFSGHVILIY